MLSDYGGLALPIIWQAQSLSVWMVRLLFRLGGYTSADHRSQVAELEGLVASRAGRTFLAERILGSRRKARE